MTFIYKNINFVNNHFSPLCSEQLAKMITGRIPCPQSELDLGITLNGGQSFRWEALDDNSYRGVFCGSIWTLSRKGEHISYTVHESLGAEKDFDTVLSNYFRLNISLQDNLQKWAETDVHFTKLYSTTAGVRILDQDAIENVFSFICSSNNNITRISGMVEKMCRFFGQKIGEVDSKEYYNFPTIEALAGSDVESILRKEGFGYRAKYIFNSAKSLHSLGGKEWLMKLHKNNNTNYESAKQQLMTLAGIGPKVADCICLMSLGHLDAIPVDTHIFQVASANYMPHLKSQKTVTPKIHQEISLHLQQLWGPLAGWAQAVVFCAKINNNIPSAKKRQSSNKVESSTVKSKKKK